MTDLDMCLNDRAAKSFELQSTAGVISAMHIKAIQYDIYQTYLQWPLLPDYEVDKSRQ